MRILQLAPPWFPVPPTGYGGIEWVASALTDGLADAGHHVTLLASGGSSTRGHLETVFATPPSAQLGSPWYEVVHALIGYLDQDRYDVVHDHCGIIGPALGALADVPVVHTLHGPWTDESVMLYRLLGPHLDLVAISNDQRRRAPLDLRITATVPNGIPVDRYPLRREKTDELLFVGRANREKGPELAVQAAARLGRRLVMAVKVNEPAEQDYWDCHVAPMIERTGVDVQVLGQVTPEQKAELLGRAACVLFPIRWPEPFGLVMAEANACGTPVVTFAEGAAPEVVADRISGRVVPAGDIDAFVGAVAEAEALDPDDCRKQAITNFSAEAMVAGYLDVYERACR